MKGRAVVVLAMWCSLPAAEQAGRIMRPVDKSALSGGEVDIVATAPGGRLELDGKPLTAEQPFPDVFHVKTAVAPGEHKLTLVWKDGQTESRFFSGPNPPAGFHAFREHPPQQNVECTQCHQLTRRGRFSFKGGTACFDCHRNEGFVKTHTHSTEILNECGLCHNAHGSTAKAHMIHTKEIACKQCHN